jgi:hypothetical protein
MEKIFEDIRLIVETNGSGEIFVTNKDDKLSQIRIGPEGAGRLLVTASFTGQLVPWSINGLSAILVKGRR